jgi:ribonuclease III
MKKLPTFKNKKLVEQAFIHRSFLNETKEKLESNERMEFLGDSILSFVVSEHLFNTYEDFNEGILTNLRSLLVNTKSLANQSRELDFGSKLKLSRGEEESKGRENDSLLANVFEAYIGALYTDQGIDAVKTFLGHTLIPKIEVLVEKRVFKDPKSLLQEYVQSQKQQSPVYKVLHEEGPPHAKVFTVGAFVSDILKGEGVGKSKQVAEEQAAKSALEKLTPPAPKTDKPTGVENKAK